MRKTKNNAPVCAILCASEDEAMASWIEEVRAMSLERPRLRAKHLPLRPPAQIHPRSQPCELYAGRAPVDLEPEIARALGLKPVA